MQVTSFTPSLASRLFLGSSEITVVSTVIHYMLWKGHMVTLA
jgi:hypothetical protein